MRKTLISLFSVLIFLSFVSVGSAQTASTTVATTTPFVIGNILKMTDRYEATIDRLSAINALIISRLEKIKNMIAGLPQSTSTKKTLADIQSDINNTKSRISDSEKAYETMQVKVEELSSSVATDSPKIIKTRLQTLKKSTIELGKSLSNMKLSNLKKKFEL
jgi:archaellum component FlaC